MKKTKRRALYIIAALLGALFILACLAGFAACGGSSEEEDGTKDDGTVQPTPSNPETTDCGDGNHKVSSWTIVTDATCTEAGSESGTCTVCGKTVTRTIEALGHDWGNDEVTAPTCKEGGYTTQTCSRCGDTQQINQTDKTTNHTWDSGVVTKEATCTEKGVMTYTCAVCGATMTDDIATIEHTWDEGSVTKEATYVAEGEKTYTCTVCGETKTEAIAKLSAKPFAEAEWSEIADVTESGAAESIYKIGDTKTVTLTADDSSIEDIEVRIIGFDQDGENTITLEMTECLSSKHTMNTEATNVGGWAQSELRAYLNKDVFGTLPEDLQSVITPVNKTASEGTGSTSATTSRDKLFLLSMAEIYSSTAITSSAWSTISSYASIYTQEGTQYEYYKDLVGDQDPKEACDDLTKTCADTAVWWWLRSANLNNEQYFWTIYTGGNCSSDAAKWEDGVSFCFVVGETEYSDFKNATWDEISEVADAGLASDKYKIGDTKTVTLTTDEDETEDIEVRIIGFDHDGSNTITLEMTECMATTHAMNSERTNAGGWESSAMREYLNDDVLETLPEDLQDVITPVDKGATSKDSLFLLSMAEVYSSTAIEGSAWDAIKNYASTYTAEGTQYEYYKDSIGDQDPKEACDDLTKTSNGEAVWWWLRTPRADNNTYFWTIYTGGNCSGDIADWSDGVSFCFVVGGIEYSDFADAEWSEISEVAAAGLASEAYSIGDTKTIELLTSEEIEVRIIGFDHDGENTITLEMTECMNTGHAMNDTKTNEGGWAQSGMKNYLNETVFNTLPDDLQNSIKTVSKSTSAGTNSTSMTTSQDKLFLLSLAEIFSDTAITSSTNSGLSAYASMYTQEGTQYEYYKETIGDQNPGAACESLVKTSNGTAVWWWLRSASLNNSENFLAVYTAGNPGGDVANWADYVSFCFVV